MIQSESEPAASFAVSFDVDDTARAQLRIIGIAANICPVVPATHTLACRTWLGHDPGIEAFDAYVASMLAPDGPVHPSAIARDLAPSILRPALAGVVTGRVEALLGPGALVLARTNGAVDRDHA